MTALAHGLVGIDATWVSSSVARLPWDGVGKLDSAVPCDGPPRTVGSIRLRQVAIEPAVYDDYYGAISNGLLWRLHIGLFEPPNARGSGPALDRSWRNYRRVSSAFAEAVDDELDRSGLALVHDHHLALLPAMLRDRRRDIAIGHFTHCPWGDVSRFASLPAHIAREIVAGMLGADLVGFHVPRWADNFLRCCERVGFFRFMDRPFRPQPSGTPGAGSHLSTRRRRCSPARGGEIGRRATASSLAAARRRRPARDRRGSNAWTRRRTSFGAWTRTHRSWSGSRTSSVACCTSYLAYANRSTVPGYAGYAAEVARRIGRSTSVTESIITRRSCSNRGRTGSSGWLR